MGVKHQWELLPSSKVEWKYRSHSGHHFLSVSLCIVSRLQPQELKKKATKRQGNDLSDQFCPFSVRKYDLSICQKVWVLAVDLQLSSQQFGEPKNKHIFWFTGVVFTCSLIQTFFYSHNKQLHTTLAQPVTVTHLCNNCLIANLTLSSSQSELDIKKKNSHSISNPSLQRITSDNKDFPATHCKPPSRDLF